MNKLVTEILEIHETKGTYVASDLFKKYLDTGKFDKFYRIEEEVYFDNEAHTIEPDNIQNYYEEGKFKFYGWIKEDYYQWINFFIVIFDDGRNFVLGDFEHVVIASNKKSFAIFKKYVTVNRWDYGDI